MWNNSICRQYLRKNKLLRGRIKFESELKKHIRNYTVHSNTDVRNLMFYFIIHILFPPFS